MCFAQFPAVYYLTNNPFLPHKRSQPLLFFVSLQPIPKPCYKGDLFWHAPKSPPMHWDHQIKDSVEHLSPPPCQ